MRLVNIEYSYCLTSSIANPLVSTVHMKNEENWIEGKKNQKQWSNYYMLLELIADYMKITNTHST